MTEEEKKAFEIFKKELSTQAFWTPDGEVCIDTLINIIIKLQAKIYKQAKEIEELRHSYDIATTKIEELRKKLSLKCFDVNVVYNDYLEKLREFKSNSIPKDKIEKIKSKNIGQYMNFYREIEELLEEE